MTKDELTTALGNLETTVELKGGKWDPVQRTEPGRR